MQRPITPAEYALLQAWAAPDAPAGGSIARRARRLLKEGDRATSPLQQSRSENRVLEILAAFRRMGMLALVDAPRAGRPPSHAPGGLAEQFTGDGMPSAARHRLWRLGRDTGETIERNRHARAVHLPSNTADGALAAVYVAHGVCLAATCPVRKLQSGIWHHPNPLARREACRTLTIDDGALQLTTLSTALTCHLQTPGPARMRAEREKIIFWCAGVARIARGGPVMLSLWARADAPLLIPVLKGLRRYSLWKGEDGRLSDLSLMNETTWQADFRRNLGASVSIALRAEDAAFAWCAGVRPKSAPQPSEPSPPRL